MGILNYSLRQFFLITSMGFLLLAPYYIFTLLSFKYSGHLIYTKHIETLQNHIKYINEFTIVKIT